MGVAALITDLFFVARVKSTADAVGVPLTVVRNVSDLTRSIEQGAGLALVDMNAEGVDPVEAVRTCKALGRPVWVVAYLAHVQKDLADAARAAGADTVMPRSQFSRELPELLKQYGG
ncbi:MAG TPA: hypothetical protein PKG54_02185 [Phycisphaerae bacterium]|jgi:CheY-like chemotaxis protein|nr:hypothetical protein [Phycisphaerae bacterium]HOB73309.1 hypothetical protein [Phycisphaerae bacterium]HOJ55709.1 hypothetical protein [Phycisphaerae bacterium]HOL26128.1 hypothetical protein [Phycisphaerae bacterium]HPP22044.1 hypothetical protein [Phycisphaerae bacterium]